MDLFFEKLKIKIKAKFITIRYECLDVIYVIFYNILILLLVLNLTIFLLTYYEG